MKSTQYAACSVPPPLTGAKARCLVGTALTSRSGLRSTDAYATQARRGPPVALLLFLRALSSPGAWLSLPPIAANRKQGALHRGAHTESANWEPVRMPSHN